jgi:hypothetical protein
MKWKAYAHPTYGTRYECSGEDQVWNITFPARTAGQPAVELRFGRRAPGAIVPHVMEIGRFAGPGEAMLAARMFAEGAIHPVAAAVREGMGFTRHFDGAEKYEPEDGKAGHFLFMTGVGQDRRETGLDYEPPGKDDTHDIARMWTCTLDNPAFVPVEGPDTARSVEEAILMELLRIRLERGPKHYRQPLTVEEYSDWAKARYGVESDPDADRPYSRATPETRDAVARSVLLGDAALRGRLGIAPGFEERAATSTGGMDETLEQMVFAHLSGDERTAFLDRLDAETEALEAANAPAP